MLLPKAAYQWDIQSFAGQLDANGTVGNTVPLEASGTAPAATHDPRVGWYMAMNANNFFFPVEGPSVQC